MCGKLTIEKLKVSLLSYFPTLSSKLVSNHLSIVFLTDYDYVVASFICRYQDIFVVEFPEGCPTPSIFQNLLFSCFMSPRLETFDVVFDKEFTMPNHSLSVHGSTPSLEAHVSL